MEKDSIKRGHKNVINFSPACLDLSVQENLEYKTKTQSLYFIITGTETEYLSTIIHSLYTRILSLHEFLGRFSFGNFQWQAFFIPGL